MKYRDYETKSLWDYLRYVFNWDKYCCILCHRNIATKKLLRQPLDKPGVCHKCHVKLNRRKTGYGGQFKVLTSINKKSENGK